MHNSACPAQEITSHFYQILQAFSRSNIKLHILETVSLTKYLTVQKSSSKDNALRVNREITYMKEVPEFTVHKARANACVWSWCIISFCRCTSTAPIHLFIDTHTPIKHVLYCILPRVTGLVEPGVEPPTFHPASCSYLYKRISLIVQVCDHHMTITFGVGQ